jgi:UDP-N-acetylglucosamine transferase subunit ALG13
MPFDRLIRALDQWSGEQRDVEIFAQIGETDFEPRHMTWTRFLAPFEFRQKFFDAELIVSHAGMGTILTALEFGTPVLAMPRRGALNETRNDHQVDTARALSRTGRISVAWDEHELVDAMNDRLKLPASPRIASHASFQLLAALRTFIREDATLPVAPPLPQPVAGQIEPARQGEERRAA